MARGRPATPLGTHGKITGPTQLPSGKYRAYTTLRLPSGKSVQVQATAASKTAALRVLEENCQKRLQGSNTTQLNTTSPLNRLLDEWLPRHEVSQRTKEIYEQNIRLHITPGIGDVRLNEINTPLLQLFLEGLSPANAKAARAVLGSACSLAVRWGLMGHNPVRDTRLAKKKRKHVQALTDEQMDAYREHIIEWCGSNQYGPKRGESLLEIVDVLRGTGCRIGEVLALRWQDVDLEAGTITIAGTIDEGRGRKDTPKTEKSRRTIHAAPIALEALQRQWDKEYRELFGEPVFPTITGEYRSVRNTETRLRAARGELKIVPHDFRRTVATRIEAKYGLLAASRHLGHESTTVTEQVYLAVPEVLPDYTEAWVGQEKTRK